MRFLVDNSLLPRLAEALQAAGHDCIHVRDRGLADADDEPIFSLAVAEGRILIAQDTDFGTLLALRRGANPSVILFRCEKKSTEWTARLLASHLPRLSPTSRPGRSWFSKMRESEFVGSRSMDE